MTVTTAIPKKRPALTHEVNETGEVVLFDEAGQRLLLLNDVGAAVWLLLDGVRSVEDIARVITETLPADLPRVQSDVITFLESLRDHGLVDLSG
jgi:hypothetical protein